MPFKPPCELLIQAVLPSIRSEIVRLLFQEYDMKQTEIAKKLGITQSAVSQYVTHTRGGEPSIIHENPEIMEFVKKMAEGVASGEIDGKDISMCIPCKLLKEKMTDETSNSSCEF